MTGMTMQALLCEQHGPPEDLRLHQAAVPEPGPGEVLIKVHAVGLNFLDSLIINGQYREKPPLPFAPGAELAGTVCRVGPGVSEFRAGDRVAAMTLWGGLAEYAVAAVDRITHVPNGMDLETAGIFTLAYGTSHYALRHRARLEGGESVLVLAASGGVGLAAVELAKAMGARVIAGASSAEKLAVAKDHGADELVDYATEDLTARVKELTGGQGCEVVYDPVGDPLARAAFRAMGWGGRYLVIGFAGGAIPQLPYNHLLVKNASVLGVFWGEFMKRMPEQHRENMRELHALHANGALKPHFAKRAGLESAVPAIRQMMDGRTSGKQCVIV